MSPIRTYTDWNKRSSDCEEKIEPYRKYFFICEGSNTEVWYFKSLIDIRKQLNIHPLIDIRLMEKTDEDAHLSNPKALIEFANKQKALPENNFDPNRDQMIIVFDCDIYRQRPEIYQEIIQTSSQNNNILAVTNPSFELFLLLHYKNSYSEIITPNIDEIFANKKVGKRRFITILFSEKSGMNPKENNNIGKLAPLIDIAIEQEKYLNQDAVFAAEKLTSNIGMIIQRIREDSIPFK